MTGAHRKLEAEYSMALCPLLNEQVVLRALPQCLVLPLLLKLPLPSRLWAPRR